MLCYSYIRFSSGEQKKGDSLRRQLEASNAYCERRGWTLDDTLNLRDLGVSAFRGKNAATGALAAFVKATETGQVKKGSALIIESVDRLSRNSIMEAQEILRSILKAGIRVVTISPEREYTWEAINENPFLLMELVLYQIRANEESATKSGRAKGAWTGKRLKLRLKPGEGHERPLTAMCPYWLKVVNQRFVPVPEKVAIVRRIFQGVIDGIGVVGMTKLLNGEGVPSIGKQSRVWHTSYVSKILHNRAVLGEYQPKHWDKDNKRVAAGPLLPNYYPQIITPEVWYKAHAALNSRRTFKGRTGKGLANLFSGILYDARDGETMRITDKGKRAQKMLVSNGAFRGQKGSHYIGFSYNIFEMALLHYIKNDLDPNSLVQGEVKEDEVETLQEIIKEQKARIERMKAVLSQPGGNFDSILETLVEVEKAKKAAEERLERAQAEASNNPQEVLKEAKTLAEVLEAQQDDPTLRHRLRNKIRQLVSEIWMLVSSQARLDRRAMIQVFLRSGGWRWIQVDYDPRRGTTMACIKGETGMDLKTWRTTKV